MKFKSPFKDYSGGEDTTDREYPEFLATRILVIRKPGPGPWRIAAALVGALVGLLLLLLGLLNSGPVSRVLEAAARRAIGERLVGAELGGHLHVGWLGTLSLDNLRLPGPTPDDPPTLVAEQVVVHPALWSLLEGKLKPRSIELRWVRLQPGPKGVWLRALAQRLADRRAGQKAEAAAANTPPPSKAAPPEVEIRDLFVDLPQGDLEAAPLSLGPIDLTAQWRLDGSDLTFDFRGALLEGKGGRFSVGGSIAADGQVDFQGGLSNLALSALPPDLFSRGAVTVTEGAFSGDVAGHLKGSTLTVNGGCTLAQTQLAWSRLAEGPVGPLDLGLRGEVNLDWKEKTFSLHQATVSLNRGEALLEASLDRDKVFQVELRLAQLDMQAAIDSLPLQLRPPPQAPRVQGPLSGDFSLRGVVGDWTKLEIRRAEFDLSGIKEVAARDGASNYLKQPFEFTPGGQEPPLRTFEVGPGNPRWTPIGSLPSYVVRAVVISEDAGFYGHHGFDFDEIKESIGRDLAEGHAVRGGSTLTQQLVKNLFLSREKKLSRKIQEALITLEIEASLPKSRILELYLNTIEWGPHLYGLGEAAERYFGVRPSELLPQQAAFLATIIPNPKKYYWYYLRGSLTAGWEEKVNRLLDKLASVGAIDAAARDAARAPLGFHRAGAPVVGSEPPEGEVQ